MGFDGDYFNLVEPSFVSTAKTADQTVTRVPSGKVYDGGPLSPIDSPRAIIEKAIQQKTSPAGIAGV